MSQTQIPNFLFRMSHQELKDEVEADKTARERVRSEEIRLRNLRSALSQGAAMRNRPSG